MQVDTLRFGGPRTQRGAKAALPAAGRSGVDGSEPGSGGEAGESQRLAWFFVRADGWLEEQLGRVLQPGQE